MKNEIGLIGLGVMGKALARNFASRDLNVSVFNRSTSVTKDFTAKYNKGLFGFEKLDEFVNSLESPRKIVLMVPAGSPVDDMINTLLPMIDKGDIVMDCGNSFFKDTMRRHKELTDKGIIYYGVGVSGGERGALLGPSIMPGGDKATYGLIETYLNAIAATKDNEPCCAYIGENGAGHYIKMVHNGIEYADMQLIAEIYLVLKNVLGKSNEEMAKIFADWNKTEVESYLVEITSKIFIEKDPETTNMLVDMIKDSASQKGTGKWTTIEALEQTHNISLIQDAVQARITSNMNDERKAISKEVTDNTISNKNNDITVDEILEAYSLGKIVAYAQGFMQISDASKTYNWNISLREVAAIFRAGCIIQAKLLDVLMRLYDNNKDIQNFLLDKSMIDNINKKLPHLRKLNVTAMSHGLPIPVLSSALTYIDQLRSDCVGANLIQAQRDFFGAHTFERVDKGGVFHHEWEDN